MEERDHHRNANQIQQDGKFDSGVRNNGQYNYHGGSFGMYMQQKISKLEQQFERRGQANYASTSKGDNTLHDESHIFQGCTVMVNGRTTIASSTIRDLVIEHGGHYANYMTDKITHVIAETLPTAKVEALRKRRKLRKVVREDGSTIYVESTHYVNTKWLLDSISQKKKLKESIYM